MNERYLKIGLVSVLLTFFAYLISRPINLFTADLGRHITNGKLLITQGLLPRTNYYSYTQPDYPFVNHHWGSGMIFYLVDIYLGFNGLSLFFISFSVLTLVVFLSLAIKLSNLQTSLFVSLILLPMLVNRTEVRPEIFSNLFIGMEMILLWLYSQKKLSPKWLLTLPMIQLLWINLHIYFVFGFLVMGFFWLESFIYNKRLSIPLTGTILVSGLISIINPSGINGLLYPLSIFNEYGYRLFENMSVTFLDNLNGYPPNLFFKLSQALLVVSFIYAHSKKKKLPLALTYLTIGFSLLAWRQVRNFTLAALVLVPLLSYNFKGLIALRLQTFSLTFAVGLVSLILIFSNHPYYQNYLQPHIGLLPNTFKSMQFFKANKLQGPIFNNYDVGGYLTYTLFPQEKVFVDNRPEAYSVSFFKDIYIPMQENTEIWKKVDALFNFNTIFFYRHDQTPWGQQLLVSKIQDPQWAPVYVDDYVIIFVKRNEANQKTIDLFEIPASFFRIQQDQ